MAFDKMMCQLVLNLTAACSLMNEVVQTSPTIGSNVEEIIWKNIRFIMWDIGGQESLRSTWNSYYTNTKVWTFIFIRPNACVYFCLVSVKFRAVLI